jgi:glycosyltransferase involved in cell wall biosynthesis
VGNLYEREVAAMLIGAFDAWRALSPGDLAHVVFEYAGGQSSYLEGARALPLEFKDYGFVPHKQAIAIRAASDLQLFALPPSVKSYCLSGKIYEMIRARVPILALTSSRGAAAELLRLTGAGAVIEPDDVEGAGRSLKQFYDEWAVHGRIAPRSGSIAVDEFSRRALAARLDAVLHEVAGR